LVVPQVAFLRAHAYNVKRTEGVLAEAARVPEACSHVQSPKAPRWIEGSPDAVRRAIDEHMKTGTEVRLKSGRVISRRRPPAHRCLVAGVASFPVPMFEVEQSKQAWQQFSAWANDTLRHLRSRYGESMVASVVHLDESHPHIHFFIVGDAQRLHPGMRAEIDPTSGKRSRDNKWRIAQHKAGLKAWLDDYYLAVARHHDLDRKIGSRPTWRIKDRQLRSGLEALKGQLLETQDVQEQAQAQWEDLYDNAEKVPRPRMRF
jgi:hypothetical protein